MNIRNAIPKKVKSFLREPLNQTIRNNIGFFNAIDGLLHTREIPVHIPVHTMLSLHEREFLFKLAKTLKPHSTVVEVGCYAGGSTYFLGKGAEQSQSKVYAIDPFTTAVEKQKAEDDGSGYFSLIRKPSLEEVQQTIANAGLEKTVSLLDGFSTDVAKTWSGGVHLLWLDGNHKEAETDFYAWKPHLSRDAMIAFHDTNYPRYGRKDTTESFNQILKKERSRVLAKEEAISVITLL